MHSSRKKPSGANDVRQEASLTFAEKFNNISARRVGQTQQTDTLSLPLSGSAGAVSGRNLEAQTSRERLQFLTYETTNLRKRSQQKLQIRHQASSGWCSLTGSANRTGSAKRGGDGSCFDTSRAGADRINHR